MIFHTFLLAAQHSFTDITKCRYLRGKNSQIDFDKFDAKETLAVNRNKIINLTARPVSDDSSEEDAETNQSETRKPTPPPTRTVDQMKNINIEIHAIE